MRRRVFVAINLPEKLKKRLKEYREKFEFLPVRWTKEASLHLTLVFIGYADEQQLLEICQAVRAVAAKTEPFVVGLKQIIFAPEKKSPRMIWLAGEANAALDGLKKETEQALLAQPTGFYKSDKRAARPHITLARFKSGRVDNFKVVDAQEALDATVPINSLEIMESDLRRDGAEYLVLESCPFKE